MLKRIVKIRSPYPTNPQQPIPNPSSIVTMSRIINNILTYGTTALIKLFYTATLLFLEKILKVAH